MILGVDIGNYYTKTSNSVSFLSKVSNKSGILENEAITLNEKTMYLGEGEFDAEYRKAYKENYLYLLKGAIQKSTDDKNNKVVVGLPLGQYKEDKEYLTNRIIKSGLAEDVEIVPEGVVSVPFDYEGIVIDIGGRTTDIALIVKEGNRNRIRQPYSLPVGMLNLESSFINDINTRYGLDLLPRDANRIIKKGLFVLGEEKEVKMEAYKEFVEDIVRRVQTDYSIKTNDVMLVGGGAETLFIPFKNRIPQTQIVDNSFFANALAYGEIGRGMWS